MKYLTVVFILFLSFQNLEAKERKYDEKMTEPSEWDMPVDTLRTRCDLGLGRAEGYQAEGQNDPDGFLQLAQESLETCRIYSIKAGGWKGVNGFVALGKQLCQQSANQKNGSAFHHAFCLTNLTKTVWTITF